MEGKYAQPNLKTLLIMSTKLNRVFTRFRSGGGEMTLSETPQITQCGLQNSSS